MKSTIFLLTLGTLALTSCDNKVKTTDANAIETPTSANNPNAKGQEPILKFEHETWDFGTITEGEVVAHTFRFINNGKKALLISDVQATCGCTIPKWPREPIMPGQESTIEVEFNSSGKHDLINKDVTIYSNANPVKMNLSFKAFVKKKPEKP